MTAQEPPMITDTPDTPDALDPRNPPAFGSEEYDKLLDHTIDCVSALLAGARAARGFDYSAPARRAVSWLRDARANLDTAQHLADEYAERVEAEAADNTGKPPGTTL